MPASSAAVKLAVLELGERIGGPGSRWSLGLRGSACWRRGVVECHRYASAREREAVTRPAASLVEGPAATRARAKDMVVVVDDAVDAGRPVFDVGEDDEPTFGTPQRLHPCRLLPLPPPSQSGVEYLIYGLHLELSARSTVCASSCLDHSLQPPMSSSKTKSKAPQPKPSAQGSLSAMRTNHIRLIAGCG